MAILSAMNARYVWLGSALIGALIFPAAILAQSIEPVAGSFKEDLAKKTKLSGELVVAVMRGVGRFPGESARIRAFVPAAVSETSVRIVIRTADGLYRGEATYRVPPATTVQEALLSYPTEKNKELAAYGAGQVLCLATLEGETAGIAFTVLPCSWSEDRPDVSVQVFLNSGSAGDGGSLKVITFPAPKGERTAVRAEKVTTSNIYDNVFPLARTASGLQPVSVNVQRMSFGQYRGEINFTILTR